MHVTEIVSCPDPTHMCVRGPGYTSPNPWPHFRIWKWQWSTKFAWACANLLFMASLYMQELFNSTQGGVASFGTYLQIQIQRRFSPSWKMRYSTHRRAPLLCPVMSPHYSCWQSGVYWNNVAVKEFMFFCVNQAPLGYYGLVCAMCFQDLLQQLEVLIFTYCTSSCHQAIYVWKQDSQSHFRTSEHQCRSFQLTVSLHWGAILGTCSGFKEFSLVYCFHFKSV